MSGKKILTIHNFCWSISTTQLSTQSSTETIRAVNKQGVLPEHAKQLIGEAVADVAAMIKDEPTWEARYKKMADDVHFNGYGALAEIVDLKKEDIEKEIQPSA